MQNKLVLIVAIVAIAGGAWYGLSSSGEAPPLLTTTTTEGTTATEGTDQEIIGTLLALRAVTLSGTIFADPTFISLQDYGTTIIAEPVGRQNPFAPLGAGSRPTTTIQTQGAQGTQGTTRSTQIFTPAR